MALVLARELLVRGWGPVDVLLDDVLGSFVTITGGGPQTSEAVKLLAARGAVRDRRTWLPRTRPDYPSWLQTQRQSTTAVAWVAEYQGLTIEEAIRRAEAENRPYRVIAPGDSVTLDLNSGRHNLHLDTDGQLAEVLAG